MEARDHPTNEPITEAERGELAPEQPSDEDAAGQADEARESSDVDESGEAHETGEGHGTHEVGAIDEAAGTESRDHEDPTRGTGRR